MLQRSIEGFISKEWLGKCNCETIWHNYTCALESYSDENAPEIIDTESQSTYSKNLHINTLWEIFKIETVYYFDEDDLIYVAQTPHTKDEFELNTQIKMWCYFHSRPFVEEERFIEHLQNSSSIFELLSLSLQNDELNFIPVKINYNNKCNSSSISSDFHFKVYFISSGTMRLDSFKYVDFNEQKLIPFADSTSIATELIEIYQSKQELLTIGAFCYGEND